MQLVLKETKWNLQIKQPYFYLALPIKAFYCHHYPYINRLLRIVLFLGLAGTMSSLSSWIEECLTLFRSWRPRASVCLDLVLLIKLKNEGLPNAFEKSRLVVQGFSDKSHKLLTYIFTVLCAFQRILLCFAAALSSYTNFYSVCAPSLHTIQNKIIENCVHMISSKPWHTF